MPGIEVDFELTGIRAIPIPVSLTDLTLITGPGRILGWSLREASGDVPAAVTGSVVAPAAGATIATTGALAQATMIVKWTVQLSGAAAAADLNNFQLRHGTTVVAASINLGAAGDYPQPEVEVPVGFLETLNVVAIGAGTAGVTYTATISAEIITSPGAVVEFQDGNQPLGESAMPGQGVDQRTFPGQGLEFHQQIKVHIITGTITGAVYAIFDRQTG